MRRCGRRPRHGPKDVLPSRSLVDRALAAGRRGVYERAHSGCACWPVFDAMSDGPPSRSLTVAVRTGACLHAGTAAGAAPGAELAEVTGLVVEHEVDHGVGDAGPAWAPAV